MKTSKQLFNSCCFSQGLARRSRTRGCRKQEISSLTGFDTTSTTGCAATNLSCCVSGTPTEASSPASDPRDVQRIRLDRANGDGGSLIFMSHPDVAEILKLSVEERMRLVDLIWESLATNPSPLPLSDAHRAVLDERVAEHDRNPDDVVTREEVLAEARRRTQKGCGSCFQGAVSRMIADPPRSAF